MVTSILSSVNAVCAQVLIFGGFFYMHLDYLNEDLHAQIMMHSDSYSDRNV
ncbi:hypothetical protein APHCR_0495 [Anaplasma phagocytophilum str. CR1007]|nr:hypothetical protein APHCR_0495 [Anaplasma phagocytophilum str. CR1007]